MSHEVETMFSGNREVPWHGLGEVVDGVLTAAEAILAAGLDWGVEKLPLYVGIPREGGGPQYRKIDDKFAVTRETDQKVLGVVGSDYKLFQNSQAFEFFDTLVDSGEAKYETAGSLYGGKRIWLTAKMPNGIEVAGGDLHDMYLLLSTSHDGSLAVRGDVTPIRVVCRNTQGLAWARAKMTWSVTHREGVEGKVQEAREALALTFKGVDNFKQAADRLAGVRVSDDEFTAIMEKVFPEQKLQKPKNISAVIVNRNESGTIQDEIRPTGWGAYNSFTEWADWGKQYRDSEARMKSLTGGWAHSMRSQVAAGLLELAK